MYIRSAELETCRTGRRPADETLSMAWTQARTGKPLCNAKRPASNDRITVTPPTINMAEDFDWSRHRGVVSYLLKNAGIIHSPR